MRHVNKVLYYAISTHLVQSEDGLLKLQHIAVFGVPYTKNMLCWTADSWLLINVRVIRHKFLFAQQNMVFWATTLCYLLRGYTFFRLPYSSDKDLSETSVTFYPTTPCHKLENGT
jgi:hypothetical protein